MKDHCLQLSQAVGSYGKSEVIRSLNLELGEKGFCSIVGPNGCGKSTLLKMLTGILPCKSGEILLKGMNIRRIKRKTLSQFTAYLPQNPTITHATVVRELVSRGRFPHRKVLQLPDKRDREIIDHALEITGLSQMSERKMGELSGGQKQRVWIAMALAQESELLLLDEPTTYLDIHHKKEILTLLKELSEQGKRIITVLHDVNDARQFSDRVIAMKKGKIFFDTGLDGSRSFDLNQTEKLFGIKCQYDGESIFPLPPSIHSDEEESVEKAVVSFNLSSGYEGKTVLNEIDFSIPKGKITALLGPNGSGKTTFMKVLTGELKCWTGSVGFPAPDSRPDSSVISAMVQQENLPLNMDSRDYVLLGRYRFTSLLRHWTEEDHNSTEKLMHWLDVPLDSFLGRMSGGQQQRCRIGRIINQESEILIFDEPSSYLDLKGQAEVLELLSRINRERNRTVILILQDIWQARYYAHYVAMFKDGRLFSNGPSGEMLTTENISDLYSENMT